MTVKAITVITHYSLQLHWTIIAKYIINRDRTVNNSRMLPSEQKIVGRSRVVNHVWHDTHVGATWKITGNLLPDWANMYWLVGPQRSKQVARDCFTSVQSVLFLGPACRQSSFLQHILFLNISFSPYFVLYYHWLRTNLNLFLRKSLIVFIRCF